MTTQTERHTRSLVMISAVAAQTSMRFGMKGKLMVLKITSSAFACGREIPVEFTCEGQDRSPPLAWTGIPAGTQTFALIVDDPDAPDPLDPKMTWVHWILYNIPSGAGGLPAGVSSANLPAGSQEGINDWKRTGYGGPCPPIGRHRYYFKLYALDGQLQVHQPTKNALEQAMQGHYVGHAELMGTYQKRW